MLINKCTAHLRSSAIQICQSPNFHIASRVQTMLSFIEQLNLVDPFEKLTVCFHSSNEHNRVAKHLISEVVTIHWQRTEQNCLGTQHFNLIVKPLVFSSKRNPLEKLPYFWLVTESKKTLNSSFLSMNWMSLSKVRQRTPGINWVFYFRTIIYLLPQSHSHAD